ncbi:MAG: hypothetical protein ACR2IE_10415 [Candidatus Sumerlaeaceae bacterium]
MRLLESMTSSGANAYVASGSRANLPEDLPSCLRTLDQIETNGDRNAYVEARKLKQWLLQLASGTSAA